MSAKDKRIVVRVMPKPPFQRGDGTIICLFLKKQNNKIALYGTKRFDKSHMNILKTELIDIYVVTYDPHSHYDWDKMSRPLTLPTSHLTYSLHTIQLTSKVVTATSIIFRNGHGCPKSLRTSYVGPSGALDPQT